MIAFKIRTHGNAQIECIINDDHVADMATLLERSDSVRQFKVSMLDLHHTLPQESFGLKGFDKWVETFYNSPFDILA